MNVELTLKTGRRVLDRTVVPADQVQAQITIWSYMHGGAFGQIHWHDNAGQPCKRPRVYLREVLS